MANVDELLQKEIESLSADEEIFDLESLITDGVDAKVPIVISFPKHGETVKAGAMIRPLSIVEWNNATRLNRRPNENTTNELELVKKALYTKNGDKFPDELIDKFPTGVVVALVKEIARISGVELNSKENIQMAKELMGF